MTSLPAPPHHPPIGAQLTPDYRRAVKEITTGSARTSEVKLNAAIGWSYLIAYRGRIHLRAEMDRYMNTSEDPHGRLVGHPYTVGWRLSFTSALRIRLYTRRSGLTYGSGVLTIVHALRADAADVFTALAALDVGDTTPAETLTTYWADDVRNAAELRGPRGGGWFLRALDRALVSPPPTH